MFLNLGTLATGMNALSEVGKFVAGTVGKAREADSMVSYTSVARVEPITLVDQSLEHSDMLPQTMQSTLAIFTGYYLQAYALSTLSVGKVNLVKHLDRLNPNRDVVNAIGGRLGFESILDYEHRLPVYGDQREYSVSMESFQTFAGTVGGLKSGSPQAKAGLPAVVKPKPTPVTGLSKNAIDTAREMADLSVGNLVNVELAEGDQKSIVPISIRLQANSLSSDSLVHILSAGKKDMSLKERWHQYKAGQIEFIRDLILCQDMIDEHKKNLLDDKTDFYAAMLQRRRNNTLAGALAGPDGYSINNASNIVVLSQASATKLELAVGGQLKNYAVRKKIFDDTYLMLLVVVDPDHNRVVFYHRGIPEATQVSHRDMVASNKGTGPSVSDILQAYRAGNSPSL